VTVEGAFEWFLTLIPDFDRRCVSIQNLLELLHPFGDIPLQILGFFRKVLVCEEALIVPASWIYERAVDMS
jgi:hypothetical protein